jgi:hypothetical protein
MTNFEDPFIGYVRFEKRNGKTCVAEIGGKRMPLSALPDRAAWEDGGMLVYNTNGVASILPMEYISPFLDRF